MTRRKFFCPNCTKKEKKGGGKNEGEGDQEKRNPEMVLRVVPQLKRGGKYD